jgi:tetratricopeptide (TPR) repeat protein
VANSRELEIGYKKVGRRFTLGSRLSEILSFAINHVQSPRRISGSRNPTVPHTKLKASVFSINRHRPLSEAAASEWIAPLRPDLVAENLVVSVLSDQPQLALALMDGLADHRAARALTLLARAALSDSAANSLIQLVLSSDFPHLAVPALAVAIESNAQVGEQLADILESHQWPLDLVGHIARALPGTSVALARTAAATFQRLADATDATAENSEKRGSNLISLSNRLSELGRREEALDAIEEAVTAYRQLAAARPDAFLPDLAMSLNNQSSCLSDLGRHEEALDAIEEAVTIRRQLTAARPRVYTARLASSLRVWAAILASLGKNSEAAEVAAEAAQLERPTP